MSPTSDRPTRGTSRPRGTARPTRTRAAASEVDAATTSPRTGAKRTVMEAIRELPNYLRLLGGLLADPRVPVIDKALVGAAIAYILLPIDVIPDFIPFIGQVDDVFLLVTALKRLISNAGRRVVQQYWKGDPAELDDLNLERVLAAAAFFLPGRVRRRLRLIGR